AAPAQDEQLTVDRTLEINGIQDIGERSGNVLASARIDTRDATALAVAAAHGLNANAVPFPFGREVGGIQRLAPVADIFEWMGKHRRMKGCRMDRIGLWSRALGPGEEIEIRRLQAVPYEFDLVGLERAEA